MAQREQRATPLELFFDLVFVFAVISGIVPLAVFFGFQRYFVQGLLAGSLT
jgi:low temperature requirement protein LtrA